MKGKKKDIEDFQLYEANIDSVIEKLELSQYSLNNLLDWFHLYIAVNYSGEQLNDLKYNSDSSKTHIASALSYLFPLLKDCDKEYNLEPYETVFTKDLMEKLKTLVKYGAFSEIAPFVWRKIYIPNVNNKILRLTYQDDYFQYEVKDAILTSLSLGFSATDDKSTYRLYDAHINDVALGIYTHNLAIIETVKSKEWYKAKRINELFVSEEIFKEIGVTKNEYIEFQSFWLGLTTYYIKTFEALIRNMRINGKKTNVLINNALYSISSPSIYKKNFYTTFTEKLIGIPQDKFYKLMDIFSFKINQEFKIQDGHYPVFIEYEDLYLFSPFNVRVQLSPRNLLYLINRYEPDLFNNKISKHLEPELLKNCIALLSEITFLDIKSNINWSNGEFDIISYDANTNCIMHIQAKASIPVEGARMTQNLEARIDEGIKQILIFNKESDSNKNTIISRIFNKTISNPTYVNVIVGWGGFGTYNTWKKLEENQICAVNIAVLNQYIIRFKNNYNMNNFYKDIEEIIQEIINRTEPKKVINRHKIDKYKINYETFQHIETKLIKYRYVP